MPPDAIVCDWNGTLIRYRDERPLLESLAVDLFQASVPFHPLRTLRILRARRTLEALYRQKRYDGDFDFVREMFHIYNQQIVRGAPMSIIRRSVERYACSTITEHALDFRTLRAIERCHLSGKTTGILSAGYLHGIESVLAAVGHRRHFHFCEADRLRHEGGKAIEFELNIYKRKPEHLLRVLADHSLVPESTAYLGDSEDDEGCFAIVGYPIVAFLAPDDLKQQYAQEYNAFVPKDERELTSYLRLG
jgi:phosphoglycolate phosphatase-like HAD superfamily hydrolase